MPTTLLWFRRLRAVLCAFLFLFPLSGLGQVVEVFSTPGAGSWTVPCGVTYVTVAVYGGGGGGGGSNTAGQAGGGGGAGGYAETGFIVTPGDVIPFTIGTGGSAGGPAGNGGAGGQTNLQPYSGLTAFGGSGGLCENNGGGGGAGGTTTLFGTYIFGENGNAGGASIGGHGGSNNGPNGGSGGLGGAAGVNGGNGFSLGSGGGGGGSKSGGANTSGGAGAGGGVVFTYNTTVTQPDAGADLDLCGITNLSGNTPDFGWTGTWTLVSGSASIASPNSPNSGISGIAAGSCATFRWTFTSPGCTSLFDEVTICNPVICNDDPCGAMPITVSTTGCSYTQYSNTGATASTGMAEPGCGNYDDNDVWFSLTVPANGQVTLQALDNGATGSVYPAIAVYEGTCDNLTHAGCDQTTSTITPSEISYNGTPGSTIYVRVWDYLDSENGFGLCAFTHTNSTGNVLPGNTSVTCGTPMTFMDPGGTGNYSVNSSAHYVICPDTPGQFVTLDFSSGFFNVENGFDAITILDGGDLTAPIIGQYTGTNSPGVVTSSASDGCLTVMFMSDYIVTQPGWQATVTCSSTAGTNNVVCSPTNCSGNCGQWICMDGIYPTTNDGNGIEDLALGTSGCFGAAGEIASKWFYFTILEDGTIEFTFDGPNGQDYDFAVWGPSTDGNPPCPFNTGEGPIRCSYAAVGNTGNPVGINAALGAGEQYEGVEGDGWVDALYTQAGETYAMILNIYMNGNPQPDIDLSIGGTGTIDCAPVFLPVEMHSLKGINQGDRNYVSWVTTNEMNNDFFTLEHSINGIDWEYAGTVDGSGTTTHSTYYGLYDNNPYFPVSYYRVRQTDYNGDFKYSETIAVNANRTPGEHLISELFPNPASTYVTFVYNGIGVTPANPLNIRVLDEFGHEVMNYNYVELLSGMPTSLRTSELGSGTYQLVASQRDQVYKQKLVVTH